MLDGMHTYNSYAEIDEFRARRTRGASIPFPLYRGSTLHPAVLQCSRILASNVEIAKKKTRPEVLIAGWVLSTFC